MSRVTSLIARFKGGSRSAYHALFAEYFPGVVSTARRQIHPAGPLAADAEDVALSAFHGLWREVADRRPLRDGLTDRHSLLRTLALLTAQKARRARRHAGRQMRDAGRTLRAADLPEGASGGRDWLVDPTPGPDARAVFRVALGEALALLTPLQRRIVEFKLEGRTNPETARLLGWSVRTIERQLSEIRSVWVESQFLGAGAAEPGRA
jgi:RNA polymerase sigma factor (sigma-70 family)